MSTPVLKPLRKRSGRARSFFSGQAAAKVKKHLFSSITLKFLCAFLLSRTQLIGGASPLGYSFFISNFSKSGTYFSAIAVIFGLFFSGKGLLAIGKYIIAIILFSLIKERFLPHKVQNFRFSAITGSLSLLLSGFFLLFADVTLGGYPLIYDSMILIVECASVWLCSHAFFVAQNLISNIGYRRTLTAEESVSLALFSGGILCGLGDSGIGQFFSFSGVLCVLCVLIFAVRFGSLQGCCVGIIMGMVSCLSKGRIDACAASFALSGLCAGYFSKYGRWSAATSFILSNAVVTILSNGSTEVLINLSDTIIAAFILYCLPKKFFGELSRFSLLSPPAFELAACRLKKAGDTVGECEKSFRKIFDLRNNEELNTLLLYRRTARNACGSCGLRKYCWGRDSKATKEAMDILCKNLHEGKEVTAENAPPHCLRGAQFSEEFAKMFDIYKNDCMWTGKVNELRAASYSTFSSISEILSLSAEKLLSSSECDSVAADNLKSELRKAGIYASEIFVSGKEKETEVYLKLDSCGGFGRCEGAVSGILESTLGFPFVRTGLRSCGKCSFNYVVKPAFSITVASAGAVKTKKKVSGDHVLYALIDRHTYAMVLCDGMGSGDSAREESKTASELLIRLICTGTEPQKAIDIINSMLLWTLSGSVAAIDLCLVNLDDGSSTIYKCGGAGSFAKVNEEVQTISSPSLPAGSFSNGDTEIFSVPSGDGSMLVMLSDGITSPSGKNDWVKEIIGTYDGTEPEALARMILSRAGENSHSNIRDDMTVLAAYIGEEKSS